MRMRCSRAVDGPEAAALYLYLFPPPPTELGAFRASMAAMAAAQDPFALAIIDRASGEAVGHATYMRIEPGHRVIEVGNILYTPRLQRSVAATETMYLMARHAFEDLGYDATSGSATPSTHPPAGRRSATASPTRAPSAAI
jgi:RimJ/RimL family protein N-acetyltransferase